MKALFLAASILALPVAASANTLTNSFDAGSEGWTLSGGVLTTPTSGGNPGGYLRMADNDDSSMTLISPTSFTGLALQDGGTIQYDFRQFVVAGADANGAGSITINGLNASATQDIIQTDISATSWTTYAGFLLANGFGVSQSVWEDIISNVQSIEINVEGSFGAPDETGFDNFLVSLAPTAIPVPASLPLLLAGFGAMAVVARRRR